MAPTSHNDDCDALVGSDSTPNSFHSLHLSCSPTPPFSRSLLRAIGCNGMLACSLASQAALFKVDQLTLRKFLSLLKGLPWETSVHRCAGCKRVYATTRVYGRFETPVHDTSHDIPHACWRTAAKVIKSLPRWCRKICGFVGFVHTCCACTVWPRQCVRCCGPSCQS